MKKTSRTRKTTKTIENNNEDSVITQEVLSQLYEINSNNNMIAIPKYPPIIVPNDLTVACFLLLFLFLWVANTAAIPAKKGVYIFEGAFHDDLSIPTSLSINNNNI